MIRALVLGSQGMLGSDLVASAPPGIAVTGMSRREADVCDPGQIGRVLDAVKPAWVINATAYSRVDDAESHEAESRAVNARAPGLIGDECRRRGVRVAHFGTDYVFPGDATEPYDEGAAVEPVNAYGRTKLEGEHALNASGAEAVIIR